MPKVRVFLADDHELILEGIRKLIESRVDLVGVARDGLELIDSACRLNPDVILLDISMPGMNGMEAARQLKQRLPGARLIFLTMHDDPGYLADAFRIGASGYMLKSSSSTELLEAIRKAAKGQRYISPPLRVQEQVLEPRPFPAKLTARQREILQLLAEGQCPKEISSRLGISVRTVEFHKYNIMERLGLRTIAELTRYALRHRLTG